MNGGVKILLERMQTHPEEFYGSYNRWTEIIDRFEKFFNASERALVNGALTNIRREEFTQIVMNELLHEPTPVEVDPNTYTINNMGQYSGGASITLNQSQNAYGYSTLQEAILKEQEQKMYVAIQKEYEKLHAQGLASQTKQQKNQSKMEQLLQRVTGKKY